MISVRGLDECLTLLGNYAQAIKHHSKYRDISQKSGYKVFPNLSSSKSEALKYLDAHLDRFVEKAKHGCAACHQVRGEDAPMLICGGCRVARSVFRLIIHGPSHHLPSAHACHTHAPAADTTICQVLQHRTPEDDIKEE